VNQRIEHLLDSPYLVAFSRLALAGLMIAASIGKLQHQALFVDTVEEYGILPHDLAVAYARAVPWAELAIGASLVLGLLSTLAAATSILLVDSLVVANIYALFQPVGESCPCFGQLVTLTHVQAFAVDCVMLLMGWHLLLWGRKVRSPGLEMWMDGWIAAAGKVKGYLLQLVMLAAVVVAAGYPVQATAESWPVDPGDRPLLMMFWGGCAECVEAEIEVVAQVELEYGSELAFARVNYLEDAETAGRFGVGDAFALLVITGDPSGDDCVVHCRFGEGVDIQALTACLDEVLGG